MYVPFIQFADDSLFMVKADLEDLQNLRYLLLIMETAMGLKVNWSKSTLSLVGTNSNVSKLARALGYRVEALLITYLGLLLGAKESSSSTWNSVTECMRRKPTGWKGYYLSKGGKLVMLKSILASVPIHFLSLFKSPKMVINNFEIIMREFLWGSSREKRKIHWVRWNNVYKPISQSGLGSRLLEVSNRVFLNK